MTAGWLRPEPAPSLTGGEEAVLGNEHGIPDAHSYTERMLRPLIVGSVVCLSTIAMIGMIGMIGTNAATGSPGGPGSTAIDSMVDFDLEVRPILSRACFECHGPDEQAREADLRLDTEDGLLAEGVVAVGASDSSELIRRITHHNPRRLMPPPEARHRLSAEEIDTIRRWIDQGAAWKGHWSFEPPKRHAPPILRASDWSRDPIDDRILADIEAAGFEPTPEADRTTLLRRASLDLTGLPPTAETIEGFLADEGDDAFERQVDRLLDTPAFGERMATPWLDLARYADTYGYQSDVGRSVWPYRDWVIRAFNQNLPHDDFLHWQIAGDLLPEPTREQRLATAFNRLHRMTNEGGSVEEEYRVESVADRVHTMGTAMLGLTTECARCHSHKFDPISHREYYELFAFFDDIEEAGLYSHFTNATPTPSLLLTTPEVDRRISEHRNTISDLETEAAPGSPGDDDRYRAWLESSPPLEGIQAIPDLVGRWPMNEILDGERLANTIDAGKPATTAGGPIPCPGPEGTIGGGLLLDGENAIRAPGAEFSRYRPFTIALRMRVPEKRERTVVMHRSRAWTDAGSQGWELLLEDGRPRWSLIHFWPGDAISIQADRSVPIGDWFDLAVVSDGSSRAEGLAIYIDGERWPTTITHDHLVKSITGGGPGPMTIGQRFRDRGFKGGEVADLRIVARACTDLEIRHLHDGTALDRAFRRPGAIEDGDLHAAYLAGFDDASRTSQAKLTEARTALARELDRTPQIMTMTELPKPRVARILERGRYDLPTEAVEPGTPAILPPFPEDAPRNRLGLADWIVESSNPLTARVAVNRLWMIAFGTGLVATPEDFGVQGIRPSHPELLDELTLDFIESGWDVKAMLRRILLSSTYRQSSIVSPALRERDPGNVLLARAPARRLSAEMMRDQALVASGLLVDTIGGPSVYPYEPDGLWQEKSGHRYPTSSGDGLHRRSLYTYWKRTSPPPAMMILDSAKRDVCVARRSETATPLQALLLLNDPQFVEASRVLAERVLAETDSIDAAIAAGFLRLASRPPTGEELEILRNLHDSETTTYRNDPRAAATIAAIGEHPRREGLDDAEVAAMTLVCSAIMNTDAATMRR